ncbi:hypothetical protein [uncultured Sphingomonas sp.]|uniref:hypothetical protein n=1 Tax=uncultured Sphingomonas sp. TaxID=158754 RepID=UPI0025E5D874|nr:hypothetical protein [uncultured Sphingomonas sp.]
MPHTPDCSKCGSSMAAGFVLDQTDSFYVVGKWIAGAPVKSIWTGLKLRGRDQHEITTFRCGRCGFLESYALST